MKTHYDQEGFLLVRGGTLKISVWCVLTVCIYRLLQSYNVFFTDNNHRHVLCCTNINYSNVMCFTNINHHNVLCYTSPEFTTVIIMGMWNQLVA